MIVDNFVIVPLQVQQIVPYGIGSVRIDKSTGHIIILVSAGDVYGRVMDEKIRAGKVDSFRLVPHYKELA